jgi:phosphopantothenoylcysteine decarboxylase/phosphopantothenate--cysteine ligase
VTKEGSGFGTDTNEVTIINKKGEAEHLPLMSKRDVADKILDRVAAMMGRKLRARD